MTQTGSVIRSRYNVIKVRGNGGDERFMLRLFQYANRPTTMIECDRADFEALAIDLAEILGWTVDTKRYHTVDRGIVLREP